MRHSRENTVKERGDYQKRRRKRQCKEKKQRRQQERMLTSLSAERTLLFPSVKEISPEELQPYEGTNDVCGNGAFGTVRIKQWRSLVVAVKTVTGHAACKRIITEAYHLEQCNKYKLHPNVLYFVGVVLPNKRDAILSGASLVTEYCSVDGNATTLTDLLRHRQDLQTEIRSKKVEYSLVLDIVAGLIHIHSAHILHNDLHTGNVLLKKNTGCGFIIAVISDFGLSSTFTSSRKYSGQSTNAAAREFHERHPHLAPEVTNSNPTAKSDIYSLGYLLTRYILTFVDTSSVIKPIADMCLREPDMRPKLSTIKMYIDTMKPITRRASINC